MHPEKKQHFCFVAVPLLLNQFSKTLCEIESTQNEEKNETFHLEMVASWSQDMNKEFAENAINVILNMVNIVNKTSEPVN